jgi:hypothetical protein
LSFGHKNGFNNNIIKTHGSTGKDKELSKSRMFFPNKKKIDQAEKWIINPDGRKN